MTNIPGAPTANGLSRRDALKTASAGFGYLALAGLLGETVAAEKPVAPRKIRNTRPLARQDE